ncbi:MAG: MBL fold metallo-hydrolase [Candidatus Hydrogenedentes bacterium]|nr:MBL fold metallo-hydrolase [Candidatus Hydrogenedentota bacterium]
MNDVSLATGIFPIALPTPFIVGPVNAFLVKRDPVLLVDTGVGTEESFDALTAGLAACGIALRDVEAILVTHGHIDHIGQLARLIDESGAKSYAHESVAPHVGDLHEAEQKSRAFLLNVFHEFGVPQEIIELTSRARESFKGMAGTPKIDHVLREGETIFGFEVLHVPGHSSSDTLFVDGQNRNAITGDHVLKGVNPTPLIRRDYATGKRVKSLLEYEQSLQRTRLLDLVTMYPGHGSVITDPGEVIERILARHDRRTQKVLDRIRETPATPHQVSLTLFPQLPPEHTYLALSTAIGHLDVLEKRGEACANRENGVYSYSA